MVRDYKDPAQCDSLYDMIIELKQRLKQLESEIELLKQNYA